MPLLDYEVISRSLTNCPSRPLIISTLRTDYTRFVLLITCTARTRCGAGRKVQRGEMENLQGVRLVSPGEFVIK